VQLQTVSERRSPVARIVERPLAESSLGHAEDARDVDSPVPSP
jgi:hypothetical protein